MILGAFFFLALLAELFAQRSYSPHSVLAAGNWYRIAVDREGVFSMDVAFLASLGINTSNLPSASIRLYGNGGRMLSESNAGPWIDDLRENAILVADGGDGVFNNNDRIIFYAPGPHEWVKDSLNSRFHHRKNLYSDKAYYFLVIGGTGLRVANALPPGSAGTTVTSFTGRYFHELDTVNFLSSGKEWYGEEMSSLPGRSLTRSFDPLIPDIIAGSPIAINASYVARSAGGGSSFDTRLNGSSLGQTAIAPIAAGPYDLFAREATVIFNTVVPQPNLNVSFTYTPGSFNAQGWLNWFELFPRRSLRMPATGPLLFRDWLSVGPGSATFIIENATANTLAWDVTDPLNPRNMTGNFNSGQFSFLNETSRLREYVAFDPSTLPAPEKSGAVPNQDLHDAPPVDYLIITHLPFSSQAQRLADFHDQHNGLRTRIVTIDQVYNEFAGGQPDPVAIRDFVKMYHDKYGSDPAAKLKYLLLFGDGSFDYKDRIANNTNFVPAWENNFSLDPLSTYASDDFFGFLDDDEDINSGMVLNLLDIGIGRVPAKNIDEAKNFVDKVEAYHAAASLGPWRNQFTFIADDEDQNLHLEDAEIIAATAAATAPVFNQEKIYLDAFQQESGSGGSRYPQVNQVIDNAIFNGTLLWNYTGHGGPRRLAEETVLDQEIVNSWNNEDRLPLFMTATCDFAPYDMPQVNSIGENILLRPKTGAIALMTTTRVVFAFSNRIMNDNYLRIALQPGADGKYKTLGEAVMEAKNFTYQNSGDIGNNRKFTLLGDPAMTIAYPVWKVRPTLVNGIPTAQADTLSAGEKITITGEVTDLQGNLLTGFNGHVYPAVLDKPQTINTLGNDPGSPVTSFNAQTNVLFRGKASVANGRFEFSFRVPRDINYQYGPGRLSLYAENGSDDGNGLFTNMIVGGAGTGVDGDNEGPEIRPYLNDESFVNGGVSNENPVLLLKLSDSSGINTVGTGIGHDIIATLDNDNRQFFVLNDYYQGELDSYQAGEVRFQLPAMEPGPHSLRIKAWDVMNNSSEVVLDFNVARDEELAISHVLNYPNPFTTHTQFWFEHNKPGQELQVRVQIFTLSGKVIKTLKKTINTPSNRSNDLEWDGRDEYGDKIARGVYLYRLTVSAPGKLKKERIEKLVIF